MKSHIVIGDPLWVKNFNLVKEALQRRPAKSRAQLAEECGIAISSFKRYIKHVPEDIVIAYKQARCEYLDNNKQKVVNDKNSDWSTTAEIASSGYRAKVSELNRKLKTTLSELAEARKELNFVLGIEACAKEKDANIVPVVADKVDKHEVVPVIVASDWHVEEQVKPETVNNLNVYNMAVAEDSIRQFFSNAIKLIKLESKGAIIKNAVLALLGDLINGVLRDEDLQNNQTTSIDALEFVRALIQSGIEAIIRETGVNLRVICTVGNHGRLTEKIFVSNQVHNSLEYLLYLLLRKDFANNPKVKFIIPESEYTIQDILGVRIRFHHGHMFKFNGGVGGVGVPITRKILQMNRIETADMDVIGHWHSMQNIKVCIINGSLVGCNGYSMHLGIPFEPPQQTFFLVDGKMKCISTIRTIFIERDLSPLRSK